MTSIIVKIDLRKINEIGKDALDWFAQYEERPAGPMAQTYLDFAESQLERQSMLIDQLIEELG